MHELERIVVACVSVLAAMFICRAEEAGEQVTYDQRQNGDRNIHVHVQDVGILALLDESLFSGGYGQYDYSYDYQDPEDPAQGVKPSNQETPSTSSESTPSVSDTSTEASSTPSTAVLSDSAKTTVINDEPASTTTVAVETECDDKTKTHTKCPGLKDETSEGGDKQQEAVSLIAMLLPQQGSGRRRCSPGFFRDSRGRCRRHRKPGYLALQTLPLDLPFGIQLASQPGWK